MVPEQEGLTPAANRRVHLDDVTGTCLFSILLWSWPSYAPELPLLLYVSTFASSLRNPSTFSNFIHPVDSVPLRASACMSFLPRSMDQRRRFEAKIEWTALRYEPVI